MRRLLLWMAGNKWMRRNVPRTRFARRAVRRFMPGESSEDALDAAAKFKQKNIDVLFTRLGEDVTQSDQAREAAGHYLSLIEEAHKRGINGEASVKLTHLGLTMAPDAMRGYVDALAEKAQEQGNRTVWFDMEGSAHTEATIEAYEYAKNRHPNVGICLQAYLKRTYTDVERLLPLEPRIRLVKGAYAEPAEICYQSRREVDANYLALCVSMLAAMKAGKSAFLGLGTHDVRLIAQLADHAQSIGLPKTSFDVEMLYGIRANQQSKLQKQGYKVRVLIAYGDYWYPWYMRRLAERPANVVFALRQLVP
jgi:proline dehydrogenase